MAICSFSMSNLFLLLKLGAYFILVTPVESSRYPLWWNLLKNKKTTPKHWIYSLHTYQWSQNAKNRDSVNSSKGARACVRIILCTWTPVWFGEVTQLSSSHGEAVGRDLQQPGKTQNLASIEKFREKSINS